MFQLTEFPSFQSMRSIIFDPNTEVEIRLWALYSLRHALIVSRKCILLFSSLSCSEVGA